MPFPVSVEDTDKAAGLQSAGRVPGPYQAETVPISVENEYLVLRLRPAQPAAAEISS